MKEENTRRASKRVRAAKKAAVEAKKDADKVDKKKLPLAHRRLMNSRWVLDTVVEECITGCAPSVALRIVAPILLTLIDSR